MKYIFICILCFTYSFSFTKIVHKNFIEYTTTSNFDELVYTLEDEMINDGFTVSFRANVGKSISHMSSYLNEKDMFINAKKIGFCKNSLGYKMMKENQYNLIYCPIDIVIFETKKNNITILYETAKVLNDNDTVVYNVNKIITTLIENIFE
jgi:uncharacterized protein (DUF302 family)